MRIDNHPVIPDRPPTPRESAFWKNLTDIVVSQPKMPYPDIVRAYRALEQEFVRSACVRDVADELDALETRRHIAQTMLRATHDAEQPFDVCRDNWNALVELGFSNILMFCSSALSYADSCLFNAQYDVGLEVLDMVFAEIDRRLEEPGVTRCNEVYYDWALDLLEYRRDEITAYKSSEADGDAWNERREAAMEAQAEPSQQDMRARQLISTLFDLARPLRTSSSNRPFSELQCEYRKIEAEFLSGLDSLDEFVAPEVRRHISTILLEEAHAHHESFDVCRQAWNELLQWGFGKRTDQCALTRTYAACCLFNNEPDAGLSVVEPLLAELQKQLDEGTDTEMPRRRYPREISRLQKLRNDLQALKTTA